ncbi:MAG: 3-oxoacyl-ACP synthase III [Thermoguttaceae bacterium]|jgi:3-oxoacyl-[acyl-carrier-protein] synthase-3
MRYQNVCLEAIAYTLPEEVVTSEEIEARLESVYRRLQLPEGRLELMTGIAQRRFWPPHTRPGDVSAETARKALEACALDRRHVGAVVHGSVCRDYLEPATACGVHHRLGLSPQCAIYDVSNACLGLLSGAIQIANMIELGQIRAGLVVGTESSRALVETTIEQLIADTSLTRRQIKPALASLTIGSGSAAMVLVQRELSQCGRRLLGGVVRANSSQYELCQGGVDPAGGGQSGPLMATDSEALLQQGVALAKEAFCEFLPSVGWSGAKLDRTICHQVGRAHRKLLLDALGLDPAGDYSSFERLGNTGSVALPITAALAAEAGHLQPGHRVALMGIGSGINVLILGIEWR